MLGPCKRTQKENEPGGGKNESRHWPPKRGSETSLRTAYRPPKTCERPGTGEKVDVSRRLGAN